MLMPTSDAEFIWGNDKKLTIMIRQKTATDRIYVEQGGRTWYVLEIEPEQADRLCESWYEIKHG